IPETKHVIIVLQVPPGTQFVEATIRYEVVIAKKLFGVWQYRDGGTNPRQVRWQLHTAPSFYRIETNTTVQDAKTLESQYFDVCIFCALAEEAEAFINMAERQCNVKVTTQEGTRMREKQDSQQGRPQALAEGHDLVCAW
ncbi:MAG: hypothetical protein ACJ8AG_17685, partial [Ktedonobacteraceae bacterium]